MLAQSGETSAAEVPATTEADKKEVASEAKAPEEKDAGEIVKDLQDKRDQLCTEFQNNTIGPFREKFQTLQLEQKIQVLNLPPNIEAAVKSQPGAVRLAIVDSVLTYPVVEDIFKDNEDAFRGVIENRNAFLRFQQSLKGSVQPDESDSAKKADDLLKKLNDAEKLVLNDFFDHITETASRPSPEQNKEQIQDHLTAIKGILKNVPTGEDITKFPELEGELMIQKGLLLMNGVDVATLETGGTWDGLKNLKPGEEPKKLPNNSTEASLARLGGILLVIMGWSKMAGEKMQNFVRQRVPSEKEKLQRKTNEELFDDLSSALMSQSKIFDEFFIKTSKELEKKLSEKEEEYQKTTPDEKKKTLEPELIKLKKAVEDLKVIEAKIKILEQEQQARYKIEQNVQEKLAAQGIALREGMDDWTLKFPKKQFDNPSKADNDTVYTFDGMSRILLDGSTVTIGTAVLRKDEKGDFHLTRDGKEEEIITRKKTDE